MEETLSDPTRVIAVLDEVRHMLAETQDIDQIKTIRDKAEAVRQHAKSAAWGLTLQNRAAEVKLLAERRAGTILAGLHLRGGDRRSRRRPNRIHLDDLHVSQKQSAHWQREASVPEDVFADYVHAVTGDGREVTSRGLLSLAHVNHQAARSHKHNGGRIRQLSDALQRMAAQETRFACIYADLSWIFGYELPGKSPSLAENLARLPGKHVVARAAHLHLCVPTERLEDGLTILRGWGFRYATSLVRRKTASPYSSYGMQGHDILLLGVRGNLPFHDNSLASWVEGQGGLAAAQDLRPLIERASPPPRLDLCGHRRLQGWVVAGCKMG